MLEKFYPNEYKESTYCIDFDDYYERGYRGIIFDIDNTLVEHGVKADEQAVRLFEKLKERGFAVCLLSNNKEDRVKMFNEDVNVNYIYKGGKPSVRGYQKAMQLNKTTPENTLFVGDQIFTDIYGANRTGIYSILVQPISPKEEIQIVLKRYLEKIVLHFYKKRKK